MIYKVTPNSSEVEGMYFYYPNMSVYSKCLSISDAKISTLNPVHCYVTYFLDRATEVVRINLDKH